LPTLLVALGLMILANLSLALEVGVPVVVLPILAVLACGVEVFGSEHASGSRGFLVRQGAEPGKVWLGKLIFWGPALGIVVGAFFLGLAAVEGTRTRHGLGGWPFAAIVAALMNGFMVALVCGMAIPRRITAGMVAILLGLACAVPVLGLAALGMIPIWSVFLPPVLLLGASRGWASDWMLRREGARPWIRLAGLVLVPFSVLGVVYVAYRAFGEPAVPPLVDEAQLVAETVPDAENAAVDFREAMKLWHPPGGGFDLDAMVENGWDSANDAARNYLTQSLPVLERARRGLAKPRLQFTPPAALRIDSGAPDLDGVKTVTDLAALETRERMSRGDLPGAWEDLRFQFLVAARINATTPTLIEAMTAARIDGRASGLAMLWASDPAITLKHLDRARAELRELSPPPNPARAFRVESLLIDRALDLTAAEVEKLYYQATNEARSTAMRLFFKAVFAAPWERSRARNVCRRLMLGRIENAEREPWRRTFDDVTDDPRGAFRGSELARMVFPGVSLDVFDRPLAFRKALGAFLDLRAYQLRHGGTLPPELPADGSGKPPIDPYSGKPFGYSISNGIKVNSPVAANLMSARPIPTEAGQRLLYSVGPDRIDDKAQMNHGAAVHTRGDLIFPVPFLSK
jgi:hypothetical protein